ncbi:hypothetical protein ACP70R_029093 [Stipagrostis hirtigluma subsp. patula]
MANVVLLPLLVAAIILVGAAAAVASAYVPAPAKKPAAAVGGNGSSCYSRLFAFGDSITDTGNHIYYSTAPGAAARRPYGETFFRRPTGRWSDGRLIVDFIVERLGYPYWTPYLAGKTKADFRYGANFAVATATALDHLLLANMGLDVTHVTPCSLSVQIDWLKVVLDKFPGHERKEIMASSLFLVGEVGADDYNHALFQNKTVDFVKQLVPQVVGSIERCIRALIRLGAKTLYVPGISPLGCAPRHIAFHRGGSEPSDYDETGCLRWLNELVVHHNGLLRAKVAALRDAHRRRGVSVAYVDRYGEVLGVVAAPARHGLGARTALDACCCAGGGPHNDASFAVRRCSEPSKHVSWDGLHMTEAVHRIVARGMLDGGRFAETPIMSRCKR